MSPGWVLMLLGLHITVFSFRIWLDFLCVVVAFWISVLISSNHFKTIDIWLQIPKASKNIWKVLQVILWAFVQMKYCFKNMYAIWNGVYILKEVSFYISEEISYPFFYGDLVNKLGRVIGEANFVSSGQKIIKRLLRRKYDPLIIEMNSSYECFILRAMRLSNKLLGQGYVKERLKSSLRKFYGRYGDLTKQYEVPLSRMLHDILDDDHIHWHPPLIGHYTNFWPLLI